MPREKDFLSLFIVVISVRLTSSQFPAVCVENATLPNSTCCPIPTDSTEPCGGPDRGRCVRVQLPEDLKDVPVENLKDDRFNWPTNFFENVCTCFGNFSGYMCHKCWYGNTGPNCTENIKTVRKEIGALTPEERERFISLVLKSMYTPSDYMILNTSQSADPSINPQFLNASAYQYLAYLHYYAGRNTIFGNKSMCDDPDVMTPDFAHEGPAFPLWNRLYSLEWERVFREISGDETFALPYWNWTNAGGNCSVCNNDWFGGTNRSDPFGTLSSASPFSNWRIRCKPPVSGCEVCDPHEDSGPIIRNPGGNPKFQNLPTREAVNFAMTLRWYDLEPYSEMSPNVAFINVLESFVNADGPSLKNRSTKNLVHMFLNGTMTDLRTASMDPIFIVHHTFIDKLFEIWLVKNRATYRKLVGALPGHNRHSYLVPFFPLHSVDELFRSADYFGYTYDDDDDDGSGESNLYVIIAIVVIVHVLLIAFIFGIIICRFLKKLDKDTHQPTNGIIVNTDTQPFLRNSDNNTHNKYGSGSRCSKR